MKKFKASSVNERLLNLESQARKQNNMINVILEKLETSK